MKYIWNWLKGQELDCLLQIGEAKEAEVVIFSELFYDSRISVEARVNSAFSLPKKKMIVMLSYRDLKRVFKSTDELNEYLKDNLYKKNTQKQIGSNKVIKKRTRFFIVPTNFSRTCLKVLDKIADPNYKIDDLNLLLKKLKKMKEARKRSYYVETKIKDSLSGEPHEDVSDAREITI